jgi:predicted ABC-type transport system involved in lysophospholipase L1 biosynthesis ATPase subunit
VNDTTNVIEMIDIEKTYRIADNEYPVLEGINLNIAQGEFIALIGPFRQRQVHAYEHSRLSGQGD